MDSIIGQLPVWYRQLPVGPGAHTDSMAYDEELADRVRNVLGSGADISERAMFGGPAFLFGGNMGLAVSGQGGLMIRMAPASAAVLVDDISVRPMVMRGRELDGWLRITAGAVATDPELARWGGPWRGIRPVTTTEAETVSRPARRAALPGSPGIVGVQRDQQPADGGDPASSVR